VKVGLSTIGELSLSDSADICFKGTRLKVLQRIIPEDWPTKVRSWQTSFKNFAIGNRKEGRN
jgi:hypothetical protein